MLKSELIKAVARAHPGIYKSDIAVVVETILKEMGKALMRGDTIELRRFGSLKVVNRRPVLGKNPKTGKPMEVPARWHVRFKPSEVLRDLVQNE
jgi:integration host factor subunit beta